MADYAWGKDPLGWWRLRPVGSPDWHVLNAIATVRVAYDSGRRCYKASYFYPHSTGNRLDGNAVFNSVPQARRWCEEQLAKFWEPPTIKVAA